MKAQLLIEVEIPSHWTEDELRNYAWGNTQHVKGQVIMHEKSPDPPMYVCLGSVDSGSPLVMGWAVCSSPQGLKDVVEEQVYNYKKSPSDFRFYRLFPVPVKMANEWMGGKDVNGAGD